VTIEAGATVTCRFVPGPGAAFGGWTATRFRPAPSTSATQAFTAGRPGSGTIVARYIDAGGAHTVRFGYTQRRAAAEP